MVYPSEINDKWLKNRKKQIKTISQNKTINLFYLGRFREEKGYQSLLDLFEQLSIKADLKMIGNDFKYLKIMPIYLFYLLMLKHIHKLFWRAYLD